MDRSRIERALNRLPDVDPHDDEDYLVDAMDALSRLRELDLGGAHMVNLLIRRNGRDENREADFLKHLDVIARAFLGRLEELEKGANALMGAAGYAARPASAPIPNQVARGNGLPKLPQLNRMGMNANTALGPLGRGIGGGGQPPGSAGYGMPARAGVARA